MADDGARVEVDGWADAARDLQRVSDRIVDDADAVALKTADRVLSQATGEVPKLTGALAATLFVDDGPPGEASVGYDGTAAYAGWIEFGGSRNRPAVPEGRYLYPTATASEAAFLRALDDAAARTVEGMSWSSR